jgi:hypothetical protein
LSQSPIGRWKTAQQLDGFSMKTSSCAIGPNDAHVARRFAAAMKGVGVCAAITGIYDVISS